MKSLAIVGYGRFGQLLARLMRTEFDVCIVEKSSELRQKAASEGYSLATLDDLSKVDIIVLAVPIAFFEATLRSLIGIVHDDQLIMDICSVKVYPSDLMKKYLPNNRLLATHPMFGPDSAKAGLVGLSVALCPLTASDEDIFIWEAFWRDRGVTTIRTTPKDHDRDAVYSQAFSYILAKLIRDMHVPSLTFSTASYNKLKEVGELSAHDSEQLFHDMLFYNPYFKTMVEDLRTGMNRVGVLVDEIIEEQLEARH